MRKESPLHIFTRYRDVFILFLTSFLLLISNKAFSQEIIASQYFNEDLGVISVSYDTIPVASGFVGATSTIDNWAFTGVAVDGEILTSEDKFATDPYSLKIQNFGNKNTDNHSVIFNTIDISEYDGVRFSVGFASDGEQISNDNLEISYDYYIDEDGDGVSEWVNFSTRLVIGNPNTEIEFGDEVPSVTEPNPYVTPIGAIPNAATQFRVELISINRSTSGGGGKPKAYFIDDVELIGSASEISVFGNNTLIENGQTETSVINNTDFGNAIINEGIKVFEYRIDNTGNLDLELTGDPLPVSISGDTDDFLVSVQAVTPVLPAVPSFFTVVFQPKSLGEKSITISIENSDLDENPYTFVVVGTGSDGEFTYCDPTNPPIPNDNTSFYLSTISIGTIDNISTYEDPIRYSYYSQFTTNLNREDSYFSRVSNTTLENSDSGLGIWIDYNRDGDFDDANEEVYTNLYTSSEGETEIERTFSILIPQNASVGLTKMRIAIQEGEIPTPCGPFNQVGEVEDYDVTIVNLADAVPVALVFGNGVPISDGSNTPNLADNTDFGKVEVLSESNINRFSIANLGGLDLTLNDPSPYVQIIGDTDDFELSLIPSTPIQPLDVSSFEIIFSPKSIGVKSAVISIANNDSEKDPYAFAIEGEGFIPEPEIVVLGSGIFIENGDITPRTADGTDYGNIEVNGTTLAHTFSITNNGDIDLLLYNNPIIELSSNSNFNLITPPATTISPNDGTTFTIVFDPIEPGQQTTTVSIANNDEDNNPMVFDITGFGIIDTYCGVLTPIDIPSGLSYYISNVTTENIDNTTVFDPGRYSYYPSVTPDYVLGTSYNMGLTLETEVNEQMGVSVWIDFNNDADFLDVGEEIFTDLILGSSDTSVIREFNFTIPDDAVEVITRMRVSVQKGDFPLPCGPFSQTGEIEDYLVNIIPVSEPKTEIEVVGNGAPIFNGDATPSSSNDTYFGSVDIGAGVESHTYTIKNIGDLDLVLNGNPLVELIGDTDSFSITSFPTTPILAGGSSTFTIAFDPIDTGEKSVKVEILNNDINENPFDFRIQGTGALLNDNDGDLVVNEIDLDNDNDGILNVEENSDCSNTVLYTSNSLLEDFGSQSLEIGTPSVTSPYMGTYEYLPLEVGTVPTNSENSLTANRYSVFNNIQEAAIWADDGSWQNLGDHTNGGATPTEGRMLLINTNQDLDSEYYRRELTEVEVGVPTIVSIWVLNLDTDIPDNEGRILPDMEVLIEQGANTYSVITTGGIPRAPLGDISAWKNFTGSFTPETTEPISIVIIDRAALGNGNEFALDDIEVSQTQSICDVDGDGIPNEYDLDSDNDGIYDVVEAGGVDANNNGLSDDDNDNKDNINSIGIPTSAGTGLAPTITEGGHADYIDFDSDNDGCTDAKEAYGNINADGDGDGRYGEGDPEILSNGTVSAALYITPADNDQNTIPDYIQLSQSIVRIVRSPFDATVLDGTNVILSVEMELQGEGAEVSYQWQEDSGEGFEDLVNDEKYEGVDTPLIRILNVDYSMSGNKYRVLIQSESYVCDDDYVSDEALLTIAASDLVTTKTVSDLNPNVGDEIFYSISVVNQGPQEATNVTIIDLLPVELTYISDNSNGNYNPIDGVWDIGNLSAGSTQTLIISAMVNVGVGGLIVRNQITAVLLDQLDLTDTGDVLFADFLVNDTPTASNDVLTVAEDSGVTNVDVLANDDFGGDGPSTEAIRVIGGTSIEGGTVTVNDNTTPNDPTDDSIDYTPKEDFNGADTFYYEIRDADGELSNATVSVRVSSVNDVPMAVDDPSVVIPEDSVDNIIIVLVNDDFGGDGPGTIVLATPPANGTAVLDGQGTSEITDDIFKYTPNLDYHGVDTFTYTISDIDNDTSTATVTVTITPVNDVPLAVDDATTVAEDSGVTNINILVNDDFGGDGPKEDGPIKVLSVSTAKGGTVVVNENGTPDNPTDDTIDYTPKLDFYGEDTFDYSIQDFDNDISAARVTVNVTSVNDVPLATDDTATVLEDSMNTIIPVTLNDDFGGDGPSAGTIILDLATIVNGATIVVDPNDLLDDPTDDLIDYTPAANFNGTDIFNYTITDANGDTSTATVTITVTAVDDLPTANPDVVTTDEDVSINIAVVSNDDFGGDGPSDTPITLASGSTDKGGTVVVNENGTSDNPTDDTIDYTPKEDFNGIDTFKYNIKDSDGDKVSATVTVTVNSVNDVPMAVDDPSVVLPEDSADNIIIVLVNDDFGGDGPGTFVLTTPPTNGTAVLDGQGTSEITDDIFIYTPNLDYHGVDTFTYTISDIDNETSTATVTVTVTPVNDVPLAVDDTATVAEDSGVTNIDVLVNDSFGGDGPKEDGPIKVLSASTAKGGTVVVNDNGSPDNPTDDTIDYTPKLDFYGEDTFDYSIQDFDNDISAARVTVTVTSVNDVPLATDDTATVLEDSMNTILPVTLNDDFGGDGPSAGTITLDLASIVNGATIVVDPNDLLDNPTDDLVDYTPAANFNGVDSFNYIIADTNGDPSTATVTITVTAVDDFPTAYPDTTITDEDVSISIAVVLNDDFGGDGPSDTAITLASGSTDKGGTIVVNENGTSDNPTDDTIDYTPKEDFNGTDTFKYNIKDSDGDKVSATVTVTVNPVNDVPSATDDVITVVEDSSSNIVQVLLNDDFGGDEPRQTPITVSTAAVNGAAIVNDKGTPESSDDTILYTPNPDFNGTDTFSYTIADLDNEIAIATVTITVTGVNDTPTADADAATVAEDTSLNIDVLANDDFGGDGAGTTPIRVVSPTSEYGGTVAVITGDLLIDPLDYTIAYTPFLDFNGTDTFSYEIKDLDGDIATAIVTVTVTPVNDTPTATDDPLVVITEDGGTSTLIVLNNDDFGGDGPGTFLITTDPSSGAATINDRGNSDVTDDNIKYTPDPDFNGVDTIKYTITDADGDPSTATITITVESVDDIPVANNDLATVDEDTSLNIDVLDNDNFGGDGPSVGPIKVVSGSSEKGGGVVVNDNLTPNDPTDDTIDYTPKLDFNGEDTFAYSILDLDGSIATAIVVVTVSSVNDVPMATADVASTSENSAGFEISVLNNDSFGGDGPSATIPIIVTTLPSNGTAVVSEGALLNDPTDDTIIYTPNAAFDGVDNFVYSITDINGDASEATVTVTILAVNDDPFASDDSKQIDEDSGINTIDVLVNDNFGNNGPSLTIPIILATPPTNGTAVLNEGVLLNDPSDDTIDYTPNADFFGIDTFTYTIADSDTGVSTATVTITVLNINDLPLAVDDSASMNEDGGSIEIQVVTGLSPGAVADDFGGDGPSIGTIIVSDGGTSVNVVTSLINGTVEVDDKGNSDPSDDSIIYTPSLDFNGTDSFVYSIEDSNGDLSPATVTVTVNPTDDVPAAEIDFIDILEDAPTTNINVLANDSFGGDGPSTTVPIVVTTPPLNGTAVVDSGTLPNDPVDDTIDYTPNANFNGEDYFEYRIQDADISTSTTVVLINVQSVNDLPAATDDAITFVEDSENNIIPVVVGNGSGVVVDDFGGDGPSAGSIILTSGRTTVNAVDPTSFNGTVSVSDNTTPMDPTDDFILYTPATDFFGEDSFYYTIEDSDGDRSEAMVTVTVTNENDTPLAVEDILIIDEDSGTSTVQVLDNDTFGGDGPGSVAVVVASAPTNGTAVVIEGIADDPTDDSIDYTPAANYYGADSFEYTIADSNGDTSTTTVLIYIDPVNDLPMAADDVATVEEDSEDSTIIVLLNDTFGGDGPSDGTITISSGPTPTDPTTQGGTVDVYDSDTPTDPTDDTILYTPAENFNGTDTFYYTITDSDGDTSTAEVVVTVTSINDLPMAEDDAIVINEDSPTTNIAVLVNDDFGGDGPSAIPISISVTPTANDGTVLVNDGGTPTNPTDDSIDYTPALDFYGEDTFTYTIEDVNNDQATATVIVIVLPINDLPVAQNDAATVDEDSDDTRIDVLFNDSFGGDGPNTGSITLPDGGVTGQDDTGQVTPSANDGLIIVDDNGTPTDPTDDSILYTPAADYNGIDSFTYAIEDLNGDVSLATVAILVNPVNDLPLAEIDFILLAEDAPTTNIGVTVNDDFGGDGASMTPITISTTTTASNGIIVVNDGGTPTDPTDDSIDYTPNPDYNGPDSFEYTIADSNGDTSTTTVLIYIDSVNDLPIAANDVATVDEDSEDNTIIVLPNDTFGGDGPSDGTITISSGPTPTDPTAQGGTVDVFDGGTPTDPTDDTILYTPAENFNGTDTFYYTITDSDGDTSTAEVVVTVTSINDLPMAEDDIIVINEDSPTTNIAVLVNDDFGGDGASTIPITISVTPTANDGTVVVNDGGTPTDPTDDTIDYTPALNFNGEDTFTYTIEDGNTDQATATVIVIVLPINDLPVAQNDTATVDEDSDDTKIDVLFNDSFGGDGPNSGSITLPDGGVTGQDDTGQVTPSANDGLIIVDDNGTPIDPTDDSILYTPAADYNGIDSFTYAIEDSNGDISLATVTITVNPVNDLPLAEIDFILLAEDAPATNIAVLVNDDFGGDGASMTPITISTTTTASNGTIVVNDGGTPTDPTDDSIDYTPVANYYGEDSFEYTIADSNGDTSTTTVLIYIDSVNDLPMAADDVATVDEDSEGNTIIVLPNDTFGGDGPNIGTIVLVSGNTAVNVVDPSSYNGTITVNDGGTPTDPTDDTILYTPASDFNGEDTFGYRIEDSDGDFSEALVTINVTPKPDANHDWFLTNEDEPVVIDLLVNDDDIDPNSDLTFSSPFGGVLDIDDKGTIDNILDDVITYIPFEDYNGIELFSYEICNVNNDCVSADVLISINPKIDIENDFFLMREGTKQALDLYKNDNDIPNLGVITTTFPSHGILKVDRGDTPDNPSDDFFLYTPNPDFVGIDSFTYTICDSDNPVYCETGNVIINVVYAGSNDDNVSTLEDEPVEIYFLENDLEIPENGQISFVDPINGVLEINDNNTPTTIVDDSFIYMPKADYNGEDSFVYTVCDSDDFCTSAMVTITIEPVVDAFDDSGETAYETSIDIDVFENDNDIPDGGTFTFTNPTSGSVAVGNNSGPAQAFSSSYLIYTPNNGFSGNDSFEYTVCDARDPQKCASAIVSVTVLEDPKPPRFTLPGEPDSDKKGFGFSPNGDGINDVFRVHSYDGEVFIEEMYPDFKVEIFNRWGDALYEYTHDGNSSTSQPGWDGASQGSRSLNKGEVLPAGTYFYTVYFNDGIRTPYSGWVYLSK